MDALKYLKFYLLTVYLIVEATGTFQNVYPSFKSMYNDDPDCGEPLYLTPYIESGSVDEARQLSAVNHPSFSVSSYSGYFTVDKSHQSNTFFWYFPAVSSQDAPVVIWLQGGPGASSLFGLFTENGPFYVNNGKIEPREYAWNTNHHLIYFDNPVGTGFSQTVDGYAANETIIGEQLHFALSQFYKIFPDLRDNELYVTGESYGGKYVPALCHTIHKYNTDKNSDDFINLKGFGIGNGFSDPVNQLAYGTYLYQLGLLDRSGFKQFTAYEEKGINYIVKKQWVEAQLIFDTLLDGDETPYPSLFYNLTGFKNYYNYLVPIGDDKSDNFVEILNKADFRKALHVGNLTFNAGTTVEYHMREDMMQSVAPWVLELLQHYRGVIYNGQLDIIVAYPLTENYLYKLNYSGNWKKAKRGQWWVGDELAGYAKTVGNLTEVLVRNAGHMVPYNQPKWAADLLHRLTSNKPFYKVENNDTE